MNVNTPLLYELIAEKFEAEARVKELEADVNALKYAILEHSQSCLGGNPGRALNHRLWSSILPGLSYDGTTIREPPYPLPVPMMKDALK